MHQDSTRDVTQRSLDEPIAGLTIHDLSAPAVPAAVIEAISAYGDARADNAVDSAERIGTAVRLIRESYAQLLNTGNVPSKTVELPSVGVEIGGGREVWVGDDGQRTRLRFVNNGRKTDLAISKEATEALLGLLLERVYPQVADHGLVFYPHNANNHNAFRQNVIEALHLGAKASACAPTTGDAAASVHPVAETATKSEWIQRLTKHLTANGHAEAFAMAYAEASYDRHTASGLTLEAAAHAAMAILRSLSEDN